MSNKAMPLSKEKIEQIRKDAKDFCPIRIKGPTYSYNIYKKRNAYIVGATSQAEKALCLIEALEKEGGMAKVNFKIYQEKLDILITALEKIQNGPSDRLSHSIAHTALQSYTKK